jgi:iron complex transport system ATP-binding protein
MLDDTAILSLRRRAIARAIAYVPQKHRAVFPFTVREMVAMGRVAVIGYRFAGKSGAGHGKDAVTSALERAGSPIWLTGSTQAFRAESSNRC